MFVFAGVSFEQDWGVVYSEPSYCSLTGSTVIIGCTNLPKIQIFQSSDKFWCTSRQDNGSCEDIRSMAEFRGRVNSSCNANGCTFTIEEVRPSDSGNYSFVFSDNNQTYVVEPGVSLVVSGKVLEPKCGRDIQSRHTKASNLLSFPHVDLQVAPTPVLRCHSLCPRLFSESYTWLRSGKVLAGQNSVSYSGPVDADGVFSCALQGLTDTTAPPVCKWTWEPSATTSASALFP